MKTRVFQIAASGCCVFLCLVPAFAQKPAATPPIKFAFARSGLDDVLYIYSRLAGRPVHVEAGVNATVNVMSQESIPRDQARAWLRRRLADYGIEIHDVPEEEIHVAWSADHQHQASSTPARTIDFATLPGKKSQ